MSRAADRRSVLRTLLPYVRRHRGRLAVAFSLVVAVVAIDLAQPWLLKEAIDRHLTARDPGSPAVLWMAAAYLGASLLAVALTWLQEVALQLAGQSIVREMRLDLFAHVQGLSARFFDRTGSGRIITNLVNDTEALNNLFTQSLSTTLRGALSVLLIVFFMLRLDVGVALRCLLMVPVMAAISIVFRGVLRRIYGDIRSRLAVVIGFLAENLNGMAIVQIFHQEAKQLARFDERNRALLRANVLENRVNLLFNNLTELVGDLSVAGLVWLGGGAVLGGSISFGVLYAFVGYARRFFQPINTITQQLNVWQSSLVATERIARTLGEAADVVERPGASAPAPVRGEVRFERVSFEYVPGRPVLRGVDLAIAPGRRVGFVGASGAGKSSLMNLVARFYDASEGVVSIDGKDVREWPLDALRRTVGIVQQDVTLFAGSVIDNVRFFREEIPEARVREACRLVGAERIVRRLPNGYRTVLTERGSALSAGERQLLSFARVLVFEPRILILDEATASLDSETELVLQRALRRVSRGRTLLVIAHRLSTVQEMDAIVVLDGGRVVEAGAPSELLRSRGPYWRLHRSGSLVEHAV